MAGIGIGMDVENADASSEYSYSQTTPVSMNLSEEYQFIMNQFLNAYFGSGPTQTATGGYTQTPEHAIQYNTDAIREAEANLASAQSTLDAAQEKYDEYERLSRQWTYTKEKRAYFANKAAKQQNIINAQQLIVDDLTGWLEAGRFEEMLPGASDTPGAMSATSDATGGGIGQHQNFLEQYDIAAQGVLDAAGNIPEYMSEHAGLVPGAYQDASDQYSAHVDNLIEQTMAGTSFLEELPEGVIDQMLSGISISIGGGSPMSFAPKGAAQAVADLLGTRAGERTKTISLIDQLAQGQRDYSVIPAKLQYESGLLPHTTALDYAKQYPSNMGWFTAMDNLRSLWEPMLYTTTTLGGNVPIIDASGGSDADSNAFSIGVSGGTGK